MHMSNSRMLVDKMRDTKRYSDENFNYSAYAERAFEHNTSIGILAIYSINATLESLVTLIVLVLDLDEEKWLHKLNKFYDRKDKLIREGLLTNNDSLQKLLDLRDTRNAISHWENDRPMITGTMSFLPFMFGDANPKSGDKTQTLISILTREKMSEYLRCLEDILGEMIRIQEENESDENYDLIDDLIHVKEGNLIYDTDMSIPDEEDVSQCEKR